MVRFGEADDGWDLSEPTEILVPEVTREISDRLKGAVFFAVLEALAEKVAAPDDIDLGARQAFTFSIGPCEMMTTIGESEVARLVEMVQIGASDLVSFVWSDLVNSKKINGA
jgi:3-hydroxybutyryl-CoA dehydrogenase